MAGKNDILATAGVDLSAFEAGIAKLTSRLDAAEKAGSKAASGIDKVAKSTNALKNIQFAQAYSSAIMEVATSAGVATSAVSNLSKSVGIGGDFALLKGFAAVSDIASHIPGQIGLIASGMSVLIDTAARGIVVEKKYQELAQKGSFTTQGALEKEIALQQEKIDESNTLFANLTHAAGRLTQQEKQLDSQRKNNSSELEKQSKKEIALIEDKTAGTDARISLAEIEKKKNQEIADVNSQLQKQFKGGSLDEGALKIRDSITSKIKAEADAKKSSLRISEAQNIQEASLNNAAAKRDVTLQSQFDVISAQITAEGEVLKVIESQKHVDEAAQAQKRKAINELKISYSNLQYSSGKDLEQQKLITSQIKAQAAGNKKLSALAQIRAQFELQIADAIRQGNGARAKELAMQQAMAELQAKADDFLKTPQERQKEKKDQQERNRGLRGAAAREFGKLSPEEQQQEREKRQKEQQEKRDKKAETDKGNSGKTGAYGRTNSNDFTSKPTEETVKEFQDRVAKANLDAGRDALNRVGNFQAQSLTVKDFQNAP